MIIDREKVKNVFADYVADYDITDTKVRLKVEHTYRVADLCDMIAKSLKLSREDVDLAWLLGMFHDVGRFEQLRRFNTFEDSISVNHAALSADILFIDGHVRDYIDDASEDKLMEKALRLHNVYELPKALTDRELMYSQILRDADKIDILKVNCDFPMDEIYNTTMEAFYTDDISPKVLEDSLAHLNVNRCHTVTSIDHLVGHISLVYGLVYPASVAEAMRQGYIEQMLSFESNNPKTREAMQKIRDCVHKYMNERISDV